MTYKQAAEWIVRRRTQETMLGEILFTEALDKDAQLFEIESRLRSFELSAAKGEAVDEADNAALLAARNARLDALGLSEQLLFPAPHCKQCGDTARKNGSYCGCVKVVAFGGGQNLEIPCKSFDEVDYNQFDPEHRARNEAIYHDIQTIATRYPQNKRRILTILGSTGTGKTTLAGCAATVLMERGFSVSAVTAFGFVRRARDYHTTFDTSERVQYLEPLLDADFLVIDDLGTESILKNITVEYLLNVVGERMNTGRLTMITGNLSPEGILNRYGERLYSRLMDKSIGYLNILNGKDLRTT